jgi:hypothetical protein
MPRVINRGSFEIRLCSTIRHSHRIGLSGLLDDAPLEFQLGHDLLVERENHAEILAILLVGQLTDVFIAHDGLAAFQRHVLTTDGHVGDGAVDGEASEAHGVPFVFGWVVGLIV